MPHPTLVTGAGGRTQGSTERLITNLLLLGPPALDHLSHLWQTFRKGEERYQTTDAISVVTGRKPQTLEQFFRENAGFFAGRTQEA